MPRHAAFGTPGFADKMAGEERDVRPDDRLDEVQHFVGKQPLEQRGIRKVRHIHVLRAGAGWERGELLLKVRRETGELGRREYRLIINQVAFPVVEIELRLVEAKVEAWSCRAVYIKC